MWLIYKHTNLINGKVYIGLTMQDPLDRWQNGNGYKNNKYFYNAIEKNGWNNFSHEIIEENIETREKANAREIFYIKEYNSYIGFDNCNGYNLTKGGDDRDHLGKKVYQIDIDNLEVLNVFNTIREAEHITNIDHSIIGRCCKRKNKSITAGNYYWCYEENYSASWKPQTRKDHKYTTANKPVYQIDMNTLKIIAEYISASEAGRITGHAACSITSCCDKKTNNISLGGFYWCFKKDYTKDWKPIEDKNKLKYRKVICVETGIIYESLKDASRKTNIHNDSILHCCERKQVLAGGYHWAYLEDYDKNWKEPKDNNRRKVICIETQEIYKSIAEAAKEKGGAKTIGRACKDSGYKSNGYHWAYLDEYDKNKWIAREKKNGTRRKVICVETNELFNSCIEAAKKYNFDNSSLTKCCKNPDKTAGGYHWKYVEEEGENK